MDADHCGHDLKGWARRLVYGTAALFYAGFASVAASILLGWDSSGNSEHVARDWTAWLLAKPLTCRKLGSRPRPRARGLARRDARRSDHVTLMRGAAALAVATNMRAVHFRHEASS
jgi:hypothetical protein